MNRSVHAFAAFVALAFVFSGCGGSGGGGAKGTEAAGRPGSKYDAGPRAGEEAADAALAAKGKDLFSTKGCTACHAQGRRLTGPDLAGVSMRRTEEWLEHQIGDPATMSKEDAISRELMATYALQMPNQQLTEDEIEAVIEYFKQHDQAAGLVPVAAK